MGSPWALMCNKLLPCLPNRLILSTILIKYILYNLDSTVLKQTLNKLFVVVIITTKFLFNFHRSVFHFLAGGLHVTIYN